MSGRTKDSFVTPFNDEHSSCASARKNAIDLFEIQLQDLLTANLKTNFELTLSYDETIEGWSRILDLLENETKGHARRLTDATIQLGRMLNIPDAELVHMRRGALLHDIGNMRVPDKILHKPGLLTDNEWEIIKKHTIYAYEMLSPLLFLRPALDIPYCHHERWDGTGYPQGLMGAEIPQAARIFSVVDVWDALTSKRSYREAWRLNDTIQYIAEQSGQLFDPATVDAFLMLYRNL